MTAPKKTSKYVTKVYLPGEPGYEEAKARREETETAAEVAKQPPDGFHRFERFARALFRVDKKDVPKHEPKRRTSHSAEPLPDDDLCDL